MFQRILAGVFLLASIPLFIAVWIAVKLEDGGPVLFKQKRWGKGRKHFTLYKLRTMEEGAEEKKAGLSKLNEADGPVFKIKHDPRYTRVGKFLAHTGLDELSQLLNIIRGEMAFVGPRPLPIDEAKRVPKKYWGRYKVKPGITSLWVVEGAHELSFEKWMELDLKYVRKRNPIMDINIAVSTVALILRSVITNTLGLR